MMIRNKMDLLKIVAIVIATVVAGDLYAANIGKFSLVIGTVETRENGGSWKAAKTGSVVTDRMEINTSYKSSAVVTLQNGSRLKIEQASFLAMEKYKTGDFGSATDMSLRQGSVTAFVEKIQADDQKNHMRIRTPTLVAGVRGTIEEVRHFPDTGTQVILHESAADVVNKAGRVSRVPQGGEHSADDKGNSRTASENANGKNSVALGDPSMNEEEAKGLLEKEDPVFAGSGMDAGDLMEEAAHRLDDMQEFIDSQAIDIPIDIERL